LVVWQLSKGFDVTADPSRTTEQISEGPLELRQAVCELALELLQFLRPRLALGLELSLELLDLLFDGLFLRELVCQ
jgi:hypothetical protein